MYNSLTKEEMRIEILENRRDYCTEEPIGMHVSLVMLAHNDPEGYKELLEDYPDVLEKNDFFDASRIGIWTLSAPYEGSTEVFNYVKDLFDIHGKSGFTEDELVEMGKSAVRVFEQQAELQEYWEEEREQFKEVTGYEVTEVRKIFEW